MPLSRRFALALLGALLPLTDARAEDKALTRREKGDLAIRARAILRKYCFECHGGESNRSSLSILDYKMLIGKSPPVRFVNREEPARSQVIEFIEDGSMPPGGRDGPTPAEVKVLNAWIQQRAPSFPPAFDDQTTLRVMLDDWEQQPDAVRPRLRYVSLADLVQDNQLSPDLKTAEGRLQKAILAGCGESVSPIPVDDTATLFRLDIGKVRWDTADLFVRVEMGQPADNTYPITPYDLLLLEAPDVFTPPEKGPLTGRLSVYLKATNQARPVPFLRGAWLGDVLAPGTPLADDLKSLVDLAKALEVNPKGAPPGPLAHPFSGAKSVRTPTGAIGFPPLSAWYAGDITPEPNPFGFEAQVRLPKTGNRPTIEVGVGEPFRLHITATSSVRFVLLKVLATGEVRVQPDHGDSLVKAGEPLSRGVRGQDFVIGGLLTTDKAETEHFVFLVTDNTSELPPPIVIRSRHADNLGPDSTGYPVWRFVFDRSPTVKPDRIVRKVVPIRVVRK